METGGRCPRQNDVSPRRLKRCKRTKSNVSVLGGLTFDTAPTNASSPPGSRPAWVGSWIASFGEFFDKRRKLLKSFPDVTTRCPNAWRRSACAFRHPHPRQGTRLSAPAPRAKLPGYLGRTSRLDYCGRRARFATD